jgi:hypothetical protein
LFKTSFKLELGEKEATVVAGILIFAPVEGFLPSLSFLFFVEKEPKPLYVNLSPFVRQETMESNIDVATFSHVDFGKPVSDATCAIKSFLFIKKELRYVFSGQFII